MCLAVVNASDEELADSSSGGAFSLLARSVIESGGVVYGHAFADGLQVACARVETLDELPRLRGSKYVQSNMGDAMKLVKDDLDGGRNILFSGTPCQVAGLKAYLDIAGADVTRLLLVDIVCHGVPSQAFFQDCMAYEQQGFEVRSVRFRDKREGWTCGGGVVVVDPSTLEEYDKPFSPMVSFYYERFLAGDVYRESCYSCPYAGGARPGDVTIGDFWGVDYEEAGLSPASGISLVMTNTPKGDEVLAEVKAQSAWSERPMHEALDGNAQLRHPTERPAARDRVLDEWVERGIAPLEERYHSETSWLRRKWLVKRLVKKLLKKVRP